MHYEINVRLLSEVLVPAKKKRERETGILHLTKCAPVRTLRWETSGLFLGMVTIKLVK